MADPIPALRAATRFAQGRLAKRATHVPGPVLTLFREASQVDQVQVAEHLGVSKQRINNIERSGCPRDYAERYRQAIEQIAAER